MINRIGIYRNWFLYLALLSFAPVFSFSQSDLLIYNYNYIPQSLHANPGIIPRNSLVIGLPIVSAVNNKIFNNSFTINDLLRERTQDDSLVLDVPNILPKLRENNHFSEYSSIDLFFFGVKIKRGYLSFGIKSDAYFNFYYSKDLVEFLWNGNAEYINEELDFTGTRISMNHFISYYIGYAFRTSDRFSMGFRIKSLHGLSNITMEKMNAKIITKFDQQELYSIIAESDIIINTSGIDDFSFGANSSFNVNEYLNNKKNSGFGIDIGMNWRIARNFNISLALLDIGYMYWVDKLKNYESKQHNIEFNVVSVDLTQDVNALDVFLDTLNQLFGFEETGTQYSIALPPRLNFGGFYKLHSKNRFGLLMAFRFIDGFTESAYSVSYDRLLGRHVTIKTSWSAVNGTYNNIGLGASIDIGPFQVYFLSENILGIFDPWNVNNHSIRFGLSINITKMKDIKDYDITENQYYDFRPKKVAPRPDGVPGLEEQRRNYWQRKAETENKKK